MHNPFRIIYNRLDNIKELITSIHYQNLVNKKSVVLKHTDNPFEVIDSKLAIIEELLIDAKFPDQQAIQKESRNILNTDQLMAKLGVTRPTLSKWRKEGRIPFIQVGAVVRYDLDKVLEALENKKRRSR